jgi:hypothetical protein
MIDEPPTSETASEALPRQAGGSLRAGCGLSQGEPVGIRAETDLDSRLVGLSEFRSPWEESY